MNRPLGSILSRVREVRELIREVARDGTTVILSSHILGEVEQVCSHAAVLKQGRLVAYGPISELTAGSSSVYVEVDDVDRTVRILENLEGVHAVSSEPPGLSVKLDGLEREGLVSALVQQGIGVKSIAARHRLEDAFLEVLAEERS